jgi:hypothetical protein
MGEDFFKASIVVCPGGIRCQDPLQAETIPLDHAARQGNRLGEDYSFLDIFQSVLNWSVKSIVKFWPPSCPATF